MKFNKNLFLRLVYFAIWLSLLGIALYTELFYYNAIYLYNKELALLTFPLTSAAFLAGRFYFIFKRKFKGTETGTHISRSGSYMDEDLSKEYSQYTRDFIKKNIEIFRILDTFHSKYISPTYSIRGQIPRIFVLSNFFYSLSPEERKTLIFHELGHYVRKDLSKSYILSWLIIITAGSLLIYFAVTVIAGFSKDAIFILTTLFTISFFLVVLLKRHLIRQEYAADRYAIKITGKTDELKKVLEKSLNYANEHSSPKKYAKIERNIHLRLKRLR
ncbi:MAG: M48 family metallopeptidase [Thermoplasmataceae archaeon]